MPIWPARLPNVPPAALGPMQAFRLLRIDALAYSIPL